MHYSIRRYVNTSPSVLNTVLYLALRTEYCVMRRYVDTSMRKRHSTIHQTFVEQPRTCHQRFVKKCSKTLSHSLQCRLQIVCRSPRRSPYIATKKMHTSSSSCSSSPVLPPYHQHHDDYRTNLTTLIISTEYPNSKANNSRVVLAILSFCTFSTCLIQLT